MSFFDNLKTLKVVEFDGCYKSCGGHCCNALNNDENILPMLETEFLAIQKSCKIDKSSYFYKQFKLQCGKRFRVYFLRCNKKGICNIKPLICKIYPYFPLVSVSGDLVGVREVSFYDLFYKDEKNHPCTLVKLYKNEILKSYQKSVKTLTKEPLMIFSFMALEILTDYLRGYFDENFKNVILDNLEKSAKKDFFKKNNIFNILQSNSFKDDINNLYLRLEKIYGYDLSRHFD